MASLYRRSSGLYLLSLRYGPHQLQRSLRTRDEAEAKNLQTLIEQRLRHLRDGVLVLPEGATTDDLWNVLWYGQLPTATTTRLVKKISMTVFADRYLASYPVGSKEPETIETERTHLNNLKRLIGGSTPINAIQPADLRSYIGQRQREDGNRGGKIKPDTIRKELQTFRLLWHLAKAEGCVSGECPLDDVKLPKKRQKPPFLTWEQIEQRIARGGLTEQQAKELWECLFLRETEIAALLRHVKHVARELSRFPYIYPALCFCAYTGARRSEMFRCTIDDVTEDMVMLREKKRDRDTEFTYRYVPLNRELKVILDEWLVRHPGGQFMFCKDNRQPLEDRTSREAFKAALKGSKWNVLLGYHVLRHSFASNLARSGRVSQPEIDELMGHQTEEMRLRYRHLFPEDKRRAVEVLSFTTTNETVVSR